jgi:group I intron endonuclease
MGYIYMLTSPSGKSYIGQTIKNVEERLRQHRKKYNKSTAIYRAIRKYGWENFDKDWYECPDEDLNKHEELMIDVLGTLTPGGYNLKEGGANGKLSDETKQRIRESHIGMKKSEESKQKQAESIKGENNHFYGKTHTEKTIQQMKKAQLGEKHHNSKKVYQYELDGTFIRSFASSGEATRYLDKKSSSTIRRCARGDQETAHGFKWSHVKY